MLRDDKKRKNSRLTERDVRDSVQQKIRSKSKPASFPRDCGIADAYTPAYDVKERAYTRYTRVWRLVEGTNIRPSPSVTVLHFYSPIYAPMGLRWVQIRL